MAVIFASGFEMNDTNNLDGDLWQNTSVGDIQTSNVYSGTYSLRCYAASSAARYNQVVFQASGTSDVYFQARVYVVTATTGSFLELYDGGAAGAVLTVRMATVSSQLYLRLYDNSVQLGSDYGPVSLNTHYLIEVKYIYSTKVATLYVDGVVTSATGACNSSYDNPTQLYVGWSGSQTGDFYFDDVVIDNASLPSATASGTPKGYRIVQLLGDGDGTRDTGETAPTRGGTDNGADYLQVNENPPDDATAYIIMDTNSEAVPITLESASSKITSGDLIKCVAVSARHRATSAQACAYKRKIRGSSGTWAVLDSSAIQHNDTTWKTNGDNTYLGGVRPPAFSTTDPDTSAAWTRTGLDSAQIEILVTDSSPTLWISTEWAIVVYYAPPGYSLTADAGSYTCSVEAATLARGLQLSASVGTYTLTVADAALSRGYQLAVDAASYALSVADTAWHRTYALISDAASYAVGVLEAILARGYKLASDAAAYEVTFEDVLFAKGFSLVADAASYVVEVADTAWRRTYVAVANAAAYAVDVAASTLARGLKLTADSAEYTTTGLAAILAYGRVVAAASGSFLVSVEDAIVAWGRKLSALFGDYAVTVEDAALTVTLPNVLIAGEASYVIACGDAVLTYSGEEAARRPFWVPSGRPTIKALVANVFRGRPGRTPALGRGGRR